MKVIFYPWMKGLAKCVADKKDNCRPELKNVFVEVSDSGQVVWASDAHQMQVTKLRVTRGETQTSVSVSYPTSEALEGEVQKFMIDPKEFASICDGESYELRGDELVGSGRIISIQRENKNFPFPNLLKVIKQSDKYIAKRVEGGFLRPCYELTNQTTLSLLDKLREIKKREKSEFKNWVVALYPGAKFIAVCHCGNVDEAELLELHTKCMTDDCKPVSMTARDILTMTATATKREISNGLTITPAVNKMYNVDFGVNGESLNILSLAMGRIDDDRLRAICMGEAQKKFVADTLDGIELWEWSDGKITIEAPDSLQCIITPDVRKLGGVWSTKRGGWMFDASEEDSVIEMFGIGEEQEPEPF